LPGPGPWMTPRVSVSPTPKVGGNSKGGFLKQDGSFEVEGIAPGTWQIRVEQGLRPVVALGAATVQIVDHDLEGVSLTVHAPHTLKGVIRTEGANQVLPAGLLLWLDPSEVLDLDRTTTPLKDGSFEFDNIPSGRYRVRVRGETPGQYYLKMLR